MVQDRYNIQELFMEEYKKKIEETFSSVSEDYDNRNLRFFKTSALRMIELLDLKGNENILDVAAGTGNVSIEAAKKLKYGKVLASDISGSMLNIIKVKADKKNINNIDFLESDMEKLDTGANFDIATCAFGLFFLTDMQKGLKQIVKNVKREGIVSVTTFCDNFLKPLNDMFYARLENYGIKKQRSSWEDINTVKKTINFLENAGLKEISVNKEQHGYYLENADSWWEVVMGAAMKGAFYALPAEYHEQFKKEHFKEINSLAGEKGIWMDVEIIFAQGIV